MDKGENFGSCGGVKFGDMSIDDVVVVFHSVNSGELRDEWGRGRAPLR